MITENLITEKIVKSFATIALIFAVTLVTSIASMAQDIGENDKITRPFQLSFITPLGTNGLESQNVINNVSINMLGGYSGGVIGCEVAGLYNITNGSAKGIQLAGLTNYVRNDVFAIQMAGFNNLVNGTSKGIQIAGFSNIVKGNTIGSQLAGFKNITTGEIVGAQIGGFFNYAKKVKGVQIGFLNVADSVQGASIGFLSIVKDGYRTLEIGTNESMIGAISYKIGTDRFYNIFAVGANYDTETKETAYSFGYGIGSLIKMNNKVSFNVDVVSYNVRKDELLSEEMNFLNRFSLSGAYKINTNIEIFGGISYNIQISDIYDSEGNSIDLSLVKWAKLSSISDSKNIHMYPGFSFGVRF